MQSSRYRDLRLSVFLHTQVLVVFTCDRSASSSVLQAVARIQQLEQQIQQLQYEGKAADALEYRCEGLQQDKQQLTQQVFQLKGKLQILFSMKAW